MSDAIKKLCDLLDEAGAVVTISWDCRSGWIGQDCRCWRCRGEPGPTEDETAAERDARIVDAAYREGLAMGVEMERERASNADAQRLELLFGNQTSFAEKRRDVEVYRVLQSWEGTIIEVEEESFVARLIDRTTQNGPEERAIFQLDEIDEGDRALVHPGAVFYWSVGYRRVRGRRELSSRIRLRRLPVWTEEELRELGEASPFASFFDND